MEEIYVFTPVCLADLENAEDHMYSLRQQTKNPKSLKRIDAEIIRLGEKVQSFHASLLTA